MRFLPPPIKLCRQNSPSEGRSNTTSEIGSPKGYEVRQALRTSADLRALAAVSRTDRLRERERERLDLGGGIRTVVKFTYHEIRVGAVSVWEGGCDGGAVSRM